MIFYREQLKIIIFLWNLLEWRRRQQKINKNTKIILRFKLHNKKKTILFILEWYFNSGTKKNKKKKTSYVNYLKGIFTEENNI